MMILYLLVSISVTGLGECCVGELVLIVFHNWAVFSLQIIRYLRSGSCEILRSKSNPHNRQKNCRVIGIRAGRIMNFRAGWKIVMIIEWCSCYYTSAAPVLTAIFLYLTQSLMWERILLVQRRRSVICCTTFGSRDLKLTFGFVPNGSQSEKRVKFRKVFAS